MDKQLPDTHWHVGYAKKKEDDPRRHKARCVHNQNGPCSTTRSYYYGQRCGGSSHCSEYALSMSDYKKSLDDRKTAEEIAYDNQQKYIAALAPKKEALSKSDNPYRYRPTEQLRKCLICDEPLKKMGNTLKKCSYCGMYYVNVNHLNDTDISNIIRDDWVFSMNMSKNLNPTESHLQTTTHRVTRRMCKHMNSHAKCCNEAAPLYKKRCNSKRCAQKGNYYE